MNKRAKDFRQSAWDKLSGKWGDFALFTLVFVLITGVATSTFVLALLLTGPFMLAVAMAYTNFIRTGERIKIEDMFKGFNNFGSAFLLWFVNSLFTMLWSLLFIIPGIIKSYAYSMSYYILADNPGMDTAEARRQSIQMMKGNKWRLFCLDLSFIGWLILCVLTFGILSFWITPYKEAARAEFYQDLLDKQNGVVEAAPAAAAHKEAPVAAEAATPVAEEAPVEAPVVEEAPAAEEAPADDAKSDDAAE